MTGAVAINLCPRIVKTGEEPDEADERTALLEEARACKPLKCAAVPTAAIAAQQDLVQICNRSLDIFKGILVVFMTWAHADLCLLSPALQYFSMIPHFVGNMASGLCFLGFMLAYGFSCDNAYFSDQKARSAAERFERVMRSAMLPVFAAWVCAFAWGYMCWKLPITLSGVLMILDFRVAVGNGPDFLMCFTISLLLMYPLRHLVNSGFASPSLWRRASLVFALLCVPLAFTQVIIPDCTGARKYLNYFFECTSREQFAPVLPAVPHLFYFNLGILFARSARALSWEMKMGNQVNLRVLGALFLVLMNVCLFLSYPLMTVWSSAYGNIMVPTKWGMVTRGFVNGPSLLWLLGNLFGVFLLLATSMGLYLLATMDGPAVWKALRAVVLRPVLGQLEHLGANVLMYLVVGDLCLAGLYRGLSNQWPLDAASSPGSGGALMTFAIFMVVRFVHYLGNSSRPVGAYDENVSEG
mmetsp:Transcript_127908/g.239218  ORF Transcript_127908/g.239218 Transcript_127908/m.239218 type:complete len:469 (+) Transcript_127908:146-1552(+)